MVDDALVELPDSVVKMYTELNELIGRVSPGATIRPMTTAKGPCNEIKTPGRVFQCYSSAVPALLAEIFDTTLPELRGESVLAGVVEFSESYGSLYLAFRDTREFIQMWRNWGTHLGLCSSDIAKETFYKALYLHLYRLLDDFSEGAHFEVSSEGEKTTILIHTPNQVFLCEHPLAIVSMLSCHEPVDENHLIDCIKSATRFGEMVTALAKVIDPQKFYTEVGDSVKTYH